jgi:hypothetical protein
MEGWALQQLKEEGWEWRQRENEKETRRNSRHSRWSGSEGKRSDGHHCNSRQSMEWQHPVVWLVGECKVTVVVVKSRMD